MSGSTSSVSWAHGGWYYLLLGVGAAFGTYRVLSHIYEQTSYEFELFTNSLMRHQESATQQGRNSRRRRRNRHNIIYGLTTFASPSQSDSGTGSTPDGIKGGASALEDVIIGSKDSLSRISIYGSYKVRGAASELLFDFIMRPSSLKLILNMADDKKKESTEARIRALTIIQSLIQSTSRMLLLIRAGIIRILADGMRNTDDSEVCIQCAALISVFISYRDDDIARRCRNKGEKCGLLEIVYEILLLAGRDRESDISAYKKLELNALNPDGCKARVHSVIVAICIDIAKAYALRTSFHNQMVKMGYLRALLNVAKLIPSEVEPMRAVMESMVRLSMFIRTNKDSDNESDMVPYMSELLDLGVVEVISSCLHHLDEGVSSWGAILLHEFNLRSVGTQKFAANPDLVRWLCRRLSTDGNEYTNQPIIRSLYILGEADKSVVKNIAQPHNLRRILCLVKGHEDTVLRYWCVCLVSLVASTQPSSHRWIVESPFFTAFSSINDADAPGVRAMLLPALSELISNLCKSITVAPLLHNYPVICNLCRVLLDSNILTAQMYVIFSIMKASSKAHGFLGLLVDQGVTRRLLDLVGDFKNNATQLYASKCLVTLLYSGMVSESTMFFSSFVPFLVKMNHLYWINIGVFFCVDFEDSIYKEDSKILEYSSSAWPQLDLANTDWSLRKLDYMLDTTRVLFSAMQVHLVEQKKLTGHCLSDVKTDRSIREFLAFQMNILAQIAMYLMHTLSLNEVVEEYLTPSEDTQAFRAPLESVVISAFSRLLRTPRARENCTRTGVNTVVTAYYLNNQDDPHYCAAMKDNKMLLCRDQVIRMPLSGASLQQSSNPRLQSWADLDGSIIRRNRYMCGAKGAVVNDEDESSGEKFTGDLRNPRVRCILPTLNIVLNTLEDSLQPGLMIQSPVITQRILWLMRIFYYEFPDLRGLTMGVLSRIDVKTLTKEDAVGLINLCSSYIVDTALSLYNLILLVDREDMFAGMTDTASIVRKTSDMQAAIPSILVSLDAADKPLQTDSTDSQLSTRLRSKLHAHVEEESEEKWREWLTLISYTGVSALASESPEIYFGSCNALHPKAIVMSGRFYAQLALDRYSAGWQTCDDIYSCIEPQSVSGEESNCWIIDRSGPRGTGQLNAANTTMRLGGTHNSFVNHLLQHRSPQEPSTPEFRHSFTENILSPSSVSPSHNRRHSLSSNSSACSSSNISSSNRSSSNNGRNQRTSSPFLTAIVSDPNVDADGSASVAISRPQAALVNPPGLVYHNYSPYYPSFSVLADGCTIWSSSWKFESVRMRTGVDGRLGGVHRFHVRLLTAGLIQVGWCTNQCGFYPESGIGVGDDFESIAYDGDRQRKWHGIPDSSSYGEKWKAGDIISAELDLDNGRVVFYQNGKSLGLAFGINEQGVMEGGDTGFQGLSRDRTWYPAFSLSYNQGLVFLGSDNFDQQPCSSIRGSNVGGICKTKSSQSLTAEAKLELGSMADLKEQEQKYAVADGHASLCSLGVVKAFRIRFEFQDLDTFPCIAFTLPGNKGQITLGPITDMDNLSTYLQPQWWAVWTETDDTAEYRGTPDVRNAYAADLSLWFSELTQPDVNDPFIRGKRVLTNNMKPASWVYFIVGVNGRICLAAGGAPAIVFDVGLDLDTDSGAGSKDKVRMSVDSHIWLPIVSPAIVSFEMAPLVV
ncbi:hypothetical protein GGI25_001015 [Coemansia spiralis]|uniref:B30.2/SPRY domain-containing protein n=2 Tax=Coemansia TaxID=4863 RepID=A0A9W8GBE7_9FUNG|nr:hypothetical protein EDC05_003886 [Coemansia umbellata]KAJ2621629.1 hypothetical protein GGI26_003963 [Coemansia sp. RSA 1358]KAJ2680124.1 hypothetical protein GGI25_001015 [Coemansia spiralis]